MAGRAAERIVTDMDEHSAMKVRCVCMKPVCRFKLLVCLEYDGFPSALMTNEHGVR